MLSAAAVCGVAICARLATSTNKAAGKTVRLTRLVMLLYLVHNVY